jgi:hypothetical protein
MLFLGDYVRSISNSICQTDAILNYKNAFMFLSSHTHGVQHEALKNVLDQDGRWRDLSCGDLGVAHKNDGRVLPAGLFAAGIC